MTPGLTDQILSQIQQIFNKRVLLLISDVKGVT